MRISDWSSDVCSSDLRTAPREVRPRAGRAACLRWSSSLLGQEHAAQAAAHDLDEEAAGGPVVGAHGRRIVADGDGGDPRGATLVEGAGGRDPVVDPVAHVVGVARRRWGPDRALARRPGLYVVGALLSNHVVG